MDLFLFRFSIVSKYEMSTPIFLVGGRGEVMDTISRRQSPVERASPLSCPACHPRSLSQSLGPALGPAGFLKGPLFSG